MKQYQEMIQHILKKGTKRPDRTGVGTTSVFGYETRFDISGDKLPMVTTKFTSFKHVLAELIWFLKGDTNVKFLHDHGVHIWDEWADENGEIGPMYGNQWTNWNGEGINQLQDVIDTLRTDPTSRRLCVTAWNPSVLPTERVPSENPAKGKGSLAPCHAFFQFYAEYVDFTTFVNRLLDTGNVRVRTADDTVVVRVVESKDGEEETLLELTVCPESYRTALAMEQTSIRKLLGDDFYMSLFKLSCKLTQRSCDTGLGWGFNVTSYSLLTKMVAKVVGMDCGEFVWSGGDVHIYNDHIDSPDPEKNLKSVLDRTPCESPQVHFLKKESLFDYEISDFALVNYKYHDRIRLKKAV